MPFTFSHPAAILPLRDARWPTAGLVAGSIAPDVPYFLHAPVPQYLTHSLPGVLTVDLAIAVIAVATWHAWLAPAAVDLAPDPVRARIGQAPRTWRAVRTDLGWKALLLSCIVGGLTHVAWDAFTHPNRWGVRQIPWLEEQHGAFPGFAWAQFASGLIGGAILVLAAASWWRASALPAGESDDEAPNSRPVLPPAPPAAHRLAWLAAIAAAGVAGSAAGALVALQESPNGLGFHAATWGGSAAGLATAAAAVWLARRRRASAPLAS